MRTRSAAVLVVLAGLVLVAAVAGCPRDTDRGADGDGALVVQAEPQKAEASADEQSGERPLATAASAPETPTEGEAAEPATGGGEKEKTVDEPRVTIKTTKGDIVAELFPAEAPKTVANFLALAREGYYDDMVWHRVEPGFVIQIGQGPERPNVRDEVNRHKHRPGALAMAKLGSPSPGRLSLADSATTQFYITLCSAEQAEYLNDEYTVFGQVIEGMDVVRKITTADKIETIEVPSGDD